MQSQARPSWHPPWPGFSRRDTLVIPLPDDAFAGLPDSREAHGVILQRKPEFHVTVLNRKLGSELRLRSHGARQRRELRRVFDALDWRWLPTGERWLLHESRVDAPGDHSLIELIDMPALAEFRAALSSRLAQPVPPVPAHVTLYTAGAPTGIGIDSLADFERLRLAPCQ